MNYFRLILLFAFCPALSAQSFFQYPTSGNVMDENGNPYLFPYLGGFNQPRLQLIDADTDGDLDLFVQEVSGQLMMISNDGTKTTPRWRSSHKILLLEKSFGTWFRLADMNKDGKPDLFVEKPFSLVTYYENTTTRFEPVFSLKADTLKDTGGKPVIADIGSVPEFADMDCDGDLDYFTSKSDGTISYYNLQGLNANGIPQYKLMTETFANLSLTETYCGGEALSKTSEAKHGAATMGLRDLNSDGKIDLLWSDTFTSSLLRLDNQGSCQNPAFGLNGKPYSDFVIAIGFHSSGLNTATFGDLDGDGDDDMLVGVLGGFCPDKSNDSVDNIHFYENTGTKTNPTFTLRTKRYLSTVDVGKKSAPAFGDVDGDGDLDLVVGNESTIASLGGFGRLALFENTGTDLSPSFRLKDTNWLKVPQTYNLTPTFADTDGDGDQDLYIGQFNGKIRHYQNNGNGNFTEAAREFLGIDIGGYSAPVFGDLDSDGDLDLLIGTEFGTLTLYRNKGMKTAPNFVLETTQFANIDVGDHAKPMFYDQNNDGKLDLFVGTEQDGILFWLNKSDAQQEKWEKQSKEFSQIRLAPFGTFLKTSYVAPTLFRNDLNPLFFFGIESGGLLNMQYGSFTPPANEPEVPRISLQLEAFPNPAAHETTIRFVLPAPEVVQLRIFDVLGREVKTLHNGAMLQGTHETRLDTRTLAHGVYLVRLATTKHTETMRLVVTMR